MAKIDFDVPSLCPHCNEPMQVLMPVWITPGDDSIDTGAIDYESSNPQDSSNWWCDTCESHHLPVEQIDDYQGAGHFDHHQD